MLMAERNKAIADAFAQGETRVSLAARYGLTPRRISQIAAAHGVHRYDADWKGIGSRGGRPRDRFLAALSKSDLAAYRKFRRHMGASWARQALGIAA